MECAILPQRPALAPGAVIRCHELSEKKRPTTVLVVFEGLEEIAFWRKDGQGISFDTTGIFASMMESAKQPNSFLAYDLVESTGEKFLQYYDEACRNHERSAS